MVLLSSDYPQPPHHYPFLEVQADFDFQGRFIKNDNAMAPHFPKDWDWMNNVENGLYFINKTIATLVWDLESGFACYMSGK